MMMVMISQVFIVFSYSYVETKSCMQQEPKQATDERSGINTGRARRVSVHECYIFANLAKTSLGEYDLRYT